MTNLSAERIGDQVILHWTNPEKTTDGQAVREGMTAVLCREDAATPAVCSPEQTVPAKPGPATLEETLAGAQLADPLALVSYRVEIRNVKGRSAGKSAPAYAALGAVPGPVTGLRVLSQPHGVRIEWEKGSAPVELERELVSATKARAPSSPLPGQHSDSGKISLKGGDEDAGGLIDRSAAASATYRYSAQRVRAVTLGGHALELRGVESAAVELTVKDSFPPEAPAGLAAVPGAVVSVDLSWQPNTEDDLAGYRVYRRAGEAGGWVLLTPAAVAQTAFHDGAVEAGQRYFYRVTAIDKAGNESGASAVAEETP